MARILTIPSTSYAPGAYGPFELRQLPGNAQGFRITFTREGWPTGSVATVVVEWSQNNGTTWQEIRRSTLGGGTAYNKDGTVATTSWLAQTWPGENDGTGGRRTLRGSDVRLSAIVLQTLTTAITIEAL